MSPEQARGASVDQRTDVYAIGAMLWQLCSLMVVPPSDVRERERNRSRIDRDLITIILKALAARPEDRYPNAGELAADLKAFKSGARIAARDYSLVAMLAHWTRRHRALAITLSGAIALAVVGTIVFVTSVTTQRDRADAALAVAEQEQRRATLQRRACASTRRVVTPARSHGGVQCNRWTSE